MIQVFALVYWDLLKESYDFKICDVGPSDKDPLPHPHVRVIRSYLIPGGGETIRWYLTLRERLTALEKKKIDESDLDPSDYDPIIEPREKDFFGKYRYEGSDWVLGIYKRYGDNIFGKDYFVRLFDPMKERDPRLNDLDGAEKVVCYRISKDYKRKELSDVVKNLAILANEVGDGTKAESDFPKDLDLNDYLAA